VKTVEKLSRQIYVTPTHHTASLVMQEAKAEIERLQTENTLFKSALIGVVSTSPEESSDNRLNKVIRIAQQALNR